VKKEVKKLIAAKADALAEEHGIKDKERLRRMLESHRTAASSERSPVLRTTPTAVASDSPTRSDDLRVDVSPDMCIERGPSIFGDAFKYLPEDEAFAMFESSDLNLPFFGLFQIAHLVFPATPFYTLHELSDVCEEFLVHIERNRDHLITTGYPARSFGKSKWLDNYLLNLYPVKLPVFIQGKRPPEAQEVAEREGSAERDADGNLMYDYSWIEECPMSGVLPWEDADALWDVPKGPDGQTVYLDPLRFCSYERASIISGLPSDTARRLEKSREDYLKLKIDLLNRLIRCVLSPRKDEAIWAEGLRTLSEALTEEQMTFYLKVDGLLDELEIAGHLRQYYRWYPTYNLWGGISNLIYMIGHFEKEISIGAYHRTKSAILDIPGDVWPVESYFEILGRPFQPDFDRVLHAYHELYGKEQDYWRAFEKRIAVALREEFDIPVPMVPFTKAREAKRFREDWEPITIAQGRYYGKTGRLMVMDGSLQRGRITKILSVEQEGDYDQFGYKRYDLLDFPGTADRDGRNVVVVNGHEMKLGDRQFNLLLRLAAQLKEDKEGWVHTSKLRSEEILADVEPYQIFDHLRGRLEPYLTGTSRRDLIENVRTKGYRVSTHPDFITYDRDKLLKHEDHRVKRIAEELPTQRRRKAEPQ